MPLKVVELSYPEVKDLIKKGYKTLIIPVGTIEAHGPHLPLGTDALIPEIIAREIADDLKALIAPTIFYGITSSLLRYAGTSTLSVNTLSEMLKEIIRSYHFHGFEKFIILNGHGGNIEAIKNALNELWLEDRIKSIVIHWWVFAKDITLEVFNEPGAHAGVDETAFILSEFPELVRRTDYSNETYLKINGVDVWPSPGSIILYEKGKGLPRFDENLAKEYVSKVIEAIKELLKTILNKI